MANKLKVRSAKGVQDIEPATKLLKNKVINILQDVFELYGFAPLESALLQRYETLAAKFAAGSDSDALKEIFQLKDQGKRELALRFDLTVPLAAYVAQNPNLKMPFKRYEVGRVFRDGPIKLGRYREFTQMDIDTVGTASMLADAEILAMTQSVFEKLKFDVVIKVNNRKLLNGILQQCGIDKKEEAIISIDKLDKIGKTGVTKELKEKGYSASQIKKVFELISEGITLKDLKKSITNEEGKVGLTELEELFSYLKIMNVQKAVFDVSLARGLAYYTGTAFEVFFKNKEPISSSIAGGGRYDQMIGNFLGGGRVIPAVGISFGIAPIMDALSIIEKDTAKNPAKIFILPINTLEESLKIAQQLRSKGIQTSFAIGKKGVSKNLEYASTLGIAYVAIIGEKELKAKKILLRNMQTGSQELLTTNQIIKKIGLEQ
jgi:histidyl-tRNA synthetase